MKQGIAILAASVALFGTASFAMGQQQSCPPGSSAQNNYCQFSGSGASDDITGTSGVDTVRLDNGARLPSGCERAVRR